MVGTSVGLEKGTLGALSTPVPSVAVKADFAPVVNAADAVEGNGAEQVAVVELPPHNTEDRTTAGDWVVEPDGVT